MKIEELRNKIDEIDRSMVELFAQRMQVCKEIAEEKKTSGKAVYDSERERKKLAQIAQLSGEELRGYTTSLYSLIFDLSKAYQERFIGNENEIDQHIQKAMETTPREFPDFATVACQGVEGAYSQIACEKLFRVPNILYFKNFDAVFTAIEKGLCRYGILPIENSTAGSVNQVYDLMMKHSFRVVRSVRIKVDHCLLAKENTRLEDVKEIFSHEQAIHQCSAFLKSLGDVKVTVCENTAVAARMVAESPRSDVAALSSSLCQRIYHLNCLKASVQDKDDNYTRFLCISKDLEIYPGADKTSLMAVISHKPGALYKLLSRLYSHGVNLTKLESRPLPNRNFEFMFYFDLEKSVYSPDFHLLLGEFGNLCERFMYLGSYSEIV